MSSSSGAPVTEGFRPVAQSENTDGPRWQVKHGGAAQVVIGGEPGDDVLHSLQHGNHDAELTPAQKRRKERIDKAKEAETNKYTDGVKRIEDYCTKMGITPDRLATVLQFPRTPGEDDATYMHRAAEHVFQETRRRRFGDATILPDGGEVTRDTLSRVRIPRVVPFLRGREFDSAIGKLIHHRVFRRQIEQTRGEVKTWGEGMEKSRKEWENAVFMVAVYPNRGEQGRVEAHYDARALAALIARGAEGLEEALGKVPEGEAIHPLQMMIGRFIRMERGQPEAPAPGSEIPTADFRETGGEPEPSEADAMGWGAKVRDGIGDIVQRLKPPMSVLPFITGGDTRISQMVEQIAGFASRSPEAVFRAHEALLDLQAYSDALSTVSGGRVNLMMHLNQMLGDMTRREGQDLGMLSVTDLIEHTRAAAEDYVQRHPEHGLTRLMNNANRERVRQGGDTRTERGVIRAGFLAARLAIPALRGIDDRDAKDPYLPKKPEKKKEEKVKVPEPPKWWQGRLKVGKHAEWRRQHKAAKKAANARPERVGPSGAAVRVEQQQRQQALDNMTTDQLVAYMQSEQQRRADIAAGRAATVSAEQRAREEAQSEQQRQAQEAATRREEDARLKKAREDADRAERELRALAQAGIRGLTVDSDVLTAAQGRLTTAREAAQNMDLDIRDRRAGGADVYQQQLATVLDTTVDDDTRSAAYQAISRDYPWRVSQVDEAMQATVPAEVAGDESEDLDDNFVGDAASAEESRMAEEAANGLVRDEAENEPLPDTLGDAVASTNQDGQLQSVLAQAEPDADEILRRANEAPVPTARTDQDGQVRAAMAQAEPDADEILRRAGVASTPASDDAS